MTVDACTHCPAGKSTDSPGSTASIECTDCKKGQFSREGGACKNCTAGEYSSESGESKCTFCPQGRYSKIGGQDHCNAFEDGHVCKPSLFVEPFVLAVKSESWQKDTYDLYVTLRAAAENVYFTGKPAQDEYSFIPSPAQDGNAPRSPNKTTGDGIIKLATVTVDHGKILDVKMGLAGNSAGNGTWKEGAVFWSSRKHPAVGCTTPDICGAGQTPKNGKCRCEKDHAFEGEKCTLCTLGKRVNDDQTECLQNTCRCDNGNAVVETCPVHGMEHCSSCNEKHGRYIATASSDVADRFECLPCSSPHENLDETTVGGCALMACGKGQGYQWINGGGQLTTEHVGVLTDYAVNTGFRGRNQLTAADFQCADCPDGTCSANPESGQCVRPEGESVKEYNKTTCAVTECATGHDMVTVDSTDPFSTLYLADILYTSDTNDQLTNENAFLNCDTNLGCVSNTDPNKEAIGRYNAYVSKIKSNNKQMVIDMNIIKKRINTVGDFVNTMTNNITDELKASKDTYTEQWNNWKWAKGNATAAGKALKILTADITADLEEHLPHSVIDAFLKQTPAIVTATTKADSARDNLATQKTKTCTAFARAEANTFVEYKAFYQNAYPIFIADNNILNGLKDEATVRKNSSSDQFNVDVKTINYFDRAESLVPGKSLALYFIDYMFNFTGVTINEHYRHLMDSALEKLKSDVNSTKTQGTEEMADVLKLLNQNRAYLTNAITDVDCAIVQKKCVLSDWFNTVNGINFETKADDAWDDAECKQATETTVKEDHLKELKIKRARIQIYDDGDDTCTSFEQKEPCNFCNSTNSVKSDDSTAYFDGKKCPKLTSLAEVKRYYKLMPSSGVECFARWEEFDCVDERKTKLLPAACNYEGQPVQYSKCEGTCGEKGIQTKYQTPKYSHFLDAGERKPCVVKTNTTSHVCDVICPFCHRSSDASLADSRCTCEDLGELLGNGMHNGVKISVQKLEIDSHGDTAEGCTGYTSYKLCDGACEDVCETNENSISFDLGCQSNPDCTTKQYDGKIRTCNSGSYVESLAVSQCSKLDVAPGLGKRELVFE